MRKIISILVPLLFSMATQATVMGYKTTNFDAIGTVTKYNDSLFIYSINGQSESKVAAFSSLEKNIFDNISTGNVISGSAYQNTVEVKTGSVFSFDWLWFSDEASNSFYNDFAFVNLNLGSLDWLADTSTSDWTTGKFAWTAAESALLTYTLGVFNVNDNSVKSKLIVNNISVSNPVSVPGPASLGIFAVALVGFVISRRKTKVS